MVDKLLIFTLKIQSSYVQNKELPAEESFDTLQFYAHGDTVWRIKTYAIDNDIHIYQINNRGRSLEETLAFLTESTKTHYGDVLDQEFTLAIRDPEDKDAAEAFFKEHNLHPQLVSTPDYAYWNPDGAEYKTQSRPL